MFSTEMVPTYFDGLSVRTEKIKGDEYKVWDLTLRLQPLTPALAAEIDEDVRRSLFRLNSVEVHPRLKQVLFDLPMKPQSVSWHPDPKIAKASFFIPESKVKKVHAKKEKGSPEWVLFITISIANPDGKDLLFLQEALYKQWFLDWSAAAAGLFDADEREEKKTRSRAASSGGAHEGATAH